MFSRATTRAKKNRAEDESLDTDAPTLRLAGASVAVGDHRRVRRILHGINWIIRPGEHWAVLGANGSGKSTLLRAIYGDLPAARGGVLERFAVERAAVAAARSAQANGFCFARFAATLCRRCERDRGRLPAFRRAWACSAGPRERNWPWRKRPCAGWARAGWPRGAGTRFPSVKHGWRCWPARWRTALACFCWTSRATVWPRPPARGFPRVVERAARAGAQVVVAAHRVEDLPACVNHVLRLKDGRVSR